MFKTVGPYRGIFQSRLNNTVGIMYTRLERLENLNINPLLEARTAMRWEVDFIENSNRNFLEVFVDSLHSVEFWTVRNSVLDRAELDSYDLVN